MDPAQRAPGTGPGGDSPPASPRDRLLSIVPRAVLTLETIDPDPRCVTIDGVEYRLLAYDDLSIFDHARLTRLDKRATEAVELAESDDLDGLSDDDLDTLRRAVEGAYDQIVRLVVPDAPPERVAALGSLKKRQIQLAFYDAPAGESARPATPGAGPTGARSSLRSALATAIGSTGNVARACACCLLLMAICLAWLLLTR